MNTIIGVTVIAFLACTPQTCTVTQQDNVVTIIPNADVYDTNILL